MKTGFLSFLRRWVLPFVAGLLISTAVVSAATTTVTQIAAGSEHSLFIKSDGSLWGMGSDNSGELGIGTDILHIDSPVLIVASNVVAASAGSADSFFITSDHSLWGMGDNSAGELGAGTLFSTNRPILIASNVIAVSAGGLHTLFVKSDGSLWGMGNNSFGQLGNGTYTSTNMPTQILPNNVVAVSAGIAYCSLFGKSDGSLWSMGANDEGQLGVGTAVAKTNTPQEVLSGAVFAFSCGEEHGLYVALPGFGRMSAMGANDYGQLGDGTFSNAFASKVIVPTDVSAVAAGSQHSAFLKTDGSLWTMGRNEWGQLGTCTGLTTNRPMQVIAGGVTAISAGGNYLLFIRSDGTLWGVGANDLGQLGIGHSGAGDLSCAAIRIVPPLTVDITSTTIAQTNLLLHGTNDFSPGSFHVLMATNPATPLNQWTSISTNGVGSGSFNIIITNEYDIHAAQRYYILQLFQIN
jgi:alpha-tubulin suppressor-like RCC1 family protein